MNLLDIFEGREPHQQAIDQLEQRRIADLEARMDDCARRGDKTGFQKAKEERDSYHKPNLDEGSMKRWLESQAERMSKEQFVGNAGEYGMSDEEATEFWNNINGMEESSIGQDIVNKSEKMARATPPTKAGAVASTVKNAAKWLAGKGGPGKEGPTYEGAEDIADRGEYDQEGDMAKDNIHTIVRNAKELESILGDDDNLPEWVQDKLANVKGMMTAVSEYMQTQHERDHEEATGEEGITIAEKLKGLPTKKLGSARDMGKSVRKFRSQRGLEETQKKKSEVEEGWSDAIVAQRTGRPRTPYSVFINGKKWKDFENDNHAEAVANKLRAKFEREGKDPSAITIAATDYDVKEDQKPSDPNEFRPVGKITIDPPKKLKSGETHQGINDYWKAQGQAPIYKTNEAGSPAQQAAIAIAKKKEQGIDEDVGGWIVFDPETRQIKKRFKTHTAGKSYAKTHGLGFASSEHYFDTVKQGVATEAVSNKTVKKIQGLFKQAKAGKLKSDGRKPGDNWTGPKPGEGAHAAGHGMTADSMKEEKTRLDPKCWTGKKIGNPKTKMKGGVRVNNCVPAESVNEDNEARDAVESAIIRRIMVAHKDLLMKFGPKNVMQAAEAIADEHSDVEEIGTSDVSAYVQQVERYLAMNH